MAAAGTPAEHPQEGDHQPSDEGHDQVVADLERQRSERQGHGPQKGAPVVVRQRLAGQPHVRRRKALRPQEGGQDPHVHRLLGEDDLRVIETDEDHDRGRGPEDRLRDQQLTPGLAPARHNTAGNRADHQHDRAHRSPLMHAGDSGPPRRHRRQQQPGHPPPRPRLDVVETDAHEKRVSPETRKGDDQKEDHDGHVQFILSGPRPRATARFRPPDRFEPPRRQERQAHPPTRLTTERQSHREGHRGSRPRIQRLARSRPSSDDDREPLRRTPVPIASDRHQSPPQRPALSKSARLAPPCCRIDGATPSNQERGQAEPTRPGRVGRWQAGL